jgi:hypothetical protein
MDKPYQFLIDHPLGESLPRADGYVEARYLCACNQTRDCILGKEVACGDFSFAYLVDRMLELRPQSGTGLWLVPFKGIPADDARVLLDLIYLDANCRVIAVVELFPTYRVSPSIPQAASVLALPTDTIFSSGTQVGDQVTFILTEEVEQELALHHFSSALGFTARERPKPREEAKPVAAALPQPAEEPTAAKPAETPVEAQPWMKQPSKPKNWLLRWFSRETPQDPRKVQRIALPGMIAYFWDGGAPRAHEIRNISDTGLYVVTNERWYPGTLVQMTLKKTGSNGAKVEATISLMARANRWGNDGVGLGFVVRDPRRPSPDDDQAVERDQLDQFLARIKQEKN